MADELDAHIRASILDYAQAFEKAIKLHSPKDGKRDCPVCKKPWPCRTAAILIAPQQTSEAS